MYLLSWQQVHRPGAGVDIWRLASPWTTLCVGRVGGQVRAGGKKPQFSLGNQARGQKEGTAMYNDWRQCVPAIHLGLNSESRYISSLANQRARSVTRQLQCTKTRGTVQLSSLREEKCLFSQV